MTETTTDYKQSERPKPQSGELLQFVKQSFPEGKFTDPDVMHEVIADALKEVKGYTGEFNEFFYPDKDAKINPDNSLVLRFRFVVLEDKTIATIKDLLGVDYVKCLYEPER